MTRLSAQVGIVSLVESTESYLLTYVLTYLFTYLLLGGIVPLVSLLRAGSGRNAKKFAAQALARLSKEHEATQLGTGSGYRVQGRSMRRHS